MENPGSSAVSAVSSNIQPEAAPENNATAGGERRSSVERCLKTLVHSCSCQNANCQRAGCPKMRRFLKHVRECKKNRLSENYGENGCPPCRQTIALCCYHAKKCTDRRCKVMFCRGIRAKLLTAELKRQVQFVTNLLRAVELEGYDPSVEIEP